jgi:D-alanyl-D-alanine carboxypeptidase
MPAVTSRLALVALLSTVLLAGSAPMPTAAQEPEPTPIAPPSLELALAGLAGTGAGPGVAGTGAGVAGTGAGVAHADAGVASTGAVGADGLVYEPVKVRLPDCEVGDELTRYRKVKQWNKTLLDTNLRLKRSYKPWDLVSVKRAKIAGSGKVRKLMIKDLRALAAAARRAGKPLAVRSAYRSYDYQKALFDSYVRSYGREQALKFSARPGHSEHQLGTTVDFSVGPGVPLSSKFGDSPSGRWLARNGWKYGFIMSYPKGKRSASCYGYEPWHWRYFGRDLAREIYESGQVPRRYLYTNFEIAPPS